MSGLAQPLVTIAIPTFNRAQSFFPATLASARAQSYPSVEILISDNASTDNTRALIEELRDTRIRYIRQESNIGPNNNENFCVQHASGAYVVVLPDDDLIDPDFVESCVARFAQNSDAGLVCTGTRVIDEGGRVTRESPNRVKGPSFDDLVLSWIEGKTSPYQCSTMYRAAPLKRIGLYSLHNLFNDVTTHFKVAAAHPRMNIEGIKASFRLHTGTETSKADIRAWCEESMDLLHLLCELSPKNRRALSTQGLKFLAAGNYRRALRKPFPRDILASLSVFLRHRFTLPPRWVLEEAARRRRA